MSSQRGQTPTADGAFASISAIGGTTRSTRPSARTAARARSASGPIAEGRLMIASVAPCSETIRARSASPPRTGNAVPRNDDPTRLVAQGPQSAHPATGGTPGTTPNWSASAAAVWAVPMMRAWASRAGWTSQNLRPRLSVCRGHAVSRARGFGAALAIPPGRRVSCLRQGRGCVPRRTRPSGTYAVAGDVESVKPDRGGQHASQDRGKGQLSQEAVRKDQRPFDKRQTPNGMLVTESSGWRLSSGFQTTRNARGESCFERD